MEGFRRDGHKLCFNWLAAWAADNIAPTISLFYPLYCDIIRLTSSKITQAFYLLLGCAGSWIVFWDFYIRNSVRITEGSDNAVIRITEVLLYFHLLFDKRHTTLVTKHTISRSTFPDNATNSIFRATRSGNIHGRGSLLQLAKWSIWQSWLWCRVMGQVWNTELKCLLTWWASLNVLL